MSLTNSFRNYSEQTQSKPFETEKCRDLSERFRKTLESKEKSNYLLYGYVGYGRKTAVRNAVRKLGIVMKKRLIVVEIDGMVWYT